LKPTAKFKAPPRGGERAGSIVADATGMNDRADPWVETHG
jgi:hypothetical protein